MLPRTVDAHTANWQSTSSLGDGMIPLSDKWILNLTRGKAPLRSRLRFEYHPEE